MWDTPRCISPSGFPDALVIAVEPDTNNFRLLEQNTRSYPNVRPINKALWPRRANLIIENPSDRPDAFRIQETAQATATSIPATTIQELLREVGASSVDLLKLDIEGAEKELFEDRTSADWLTRTHALIVELHDRFKPGCRAAVEWAVASHDFHRSEAGENLVFVRKMRRQSSEADTSLSAGWNPAQSKTS
jgi:FkbM family methyltransferase